MGEYMLGKEYSFENDGKNLGDMQLLKLQKETPHYCRQIQFGVHEQRKIKRVTSISQAIPFL